MRDGFLNSAAASSKGKLSVIARYRGASTPLISTPFFSRNLAAMVLSMVLFLCAPTASAFAGDSLSITPSPQPVEDRELIFTLAGQSDSSGSLRAVIFPMFTGYKSCLGYPNSDKQHNYRSEWLVPGIAVDGGVPFTHQAGIVLPDSGSYKICAYLVPSGASGPFISYERTVSVASPSSSLEIVRPQDAIDDRETEVRLTGTAGHSLRLFALVSPKSEPPSGSCSIYPFSDMAHKWRGEWLIQDHLVAPNTSFDVSTSFVPDHRTTYYLCAYLLEPGESEATLVRDAILNVRQPQSTLSFDLPNNDRCCSAVELSLEGELESDRRITIVRNDFESCWDCGDVLSAETYLNRERISFGRFRRAYTFTPERPGIYSLYAVVEDLAVDFYRPFVPQEVKMSGFFRIRRPSNWAPLPLSPDGGDTRYETLGKLTWNSVPDSTDYIQVYREIEGTSTLLRDIRVRDLYRRNGVLITLKRATNKWQALFFQRLPYGRYSWKIVRRDTQYELPDEETNVSTVNVKPRPMKRLHVEVRTRKGSSIHSPGRTRIVIRSAPMARVVYSLKRPGRGAFFERFREQRDGKTTLDFRWQCRLTGTHRFRIQATDAYGKKLSQSRSWKVPRQHCERLRVKEAAKSASDGGSGSGSSGSSDQDCSDFSTQSEAQDWFDEQGGSPSNNVDWLDGDGDGVACEELP